MSPHNMFLRRNKKNMMWLSSLIRSYADVRLLMQADLGLYGLTVQ